MTRVLTDLFASLVMVEITLWNAVDARLREDHGVRLGRYQVLQAIGRRTSDDRPGRVNDVAEDLQVTVGGISKLVDRLEASGLCERRANPADRRSSLLHLTAAGRQLLDEAEQTVESELARLLTVLPPAELEQLGRTLERLEPT